MYALHRQQNLIQDPKNSWLFWLKSIKLYITYEKVYDMGI